MVALVLPVERFVASRDTTFMTPQELDWRAGARAAGREATTAEVLCLGDSMLKFGLNPRVLEGRLGRSAYSLALMDGKPAASYYLLRRALAAGARPRAVVVDFQPECMTQTASSVTENRHWKALLSPAECLDLARTYRDPDGFARLSAELLLPTVRCRGEVRKLVLVALHGDAGINPVWNATIRRNRTLNRGGLLLARQPSYRGEVPDSYDNADMLPDRWVHRPEHTVYVRRFLRLAESRGVPVVWVLPPNTPKLQERRERLGLTARYDRFLRDVQRRFRNVYVLDARRSGFEHTDFVDPVHLDRGGAAALSLEVSETLRTFLDNGFTGPRWVRLPARREPTAALALEDVNQSKAALDARAAKVRR